MKHFLALALLLAAGVVHAQTVPGKADVSWSAVTAGCTAGVTPCDNVSLATVGKPVTAYEIYASTSPIADTSTLAPVGTVTAANTTFAYTAQVTNGSTLYFRVKAVNADGKSPFSAQASKPISLPVTPGVPTNVTITLTIG